MKEKCDTDKKCCGKKNMKHNASTGGVYFLGFIGAVIYFISQVTGFWLTVLAILKALVWPVFLVFELLKFIGA